MSFVNVILIFLNLAFFYIETFVRKSSVDTKDFLIPKCSILELVKVKCVHVIIQLLTINGEINFKVCESVIRNFNSKFENMIL